MGTKHNTDVLPDLLTKSTFGKKQINKPTHQKATPPNKADTKKGKNKNALCKITQVPEDKAGSHISAAISAPRLLLSHSFLTVHTT